MGLGVGFGSSGSAPFLLLHSMRPSSVVVDVVVASERKPLDQQALMSRDKMMSRPVLVEILVGVGVVEIEEGNAFLVVVVVPVVVDELVADEVVVEVGSVAVGDEQVQHFVVVVVFVAAVGSKGLTSGIVGTVAAVEVAVVVGVAVGARVAVVVAEDLEAVVVEVGKIQS